MEVQEILVELVVLEDLVAEELENQDLQPHLQLEIMELLTPEAVEVALDLDLDTQVLVETVDQV